MSDLFGKTTVVNVKHHPYDVYIGRPRKGYKTAHLGNPHPILIRCNVCSDGRNEVIHKRGEAIKFFEEYFYKRVEKDEWFRNLVIECKGKTLGCWCLSRNGTGRCHGQIIANWLDNL